MSKLGRVGKAKRTHRLSFSVGNVKALPTLRPRRGMARRKAQTYGVRDPCGPRRAPLGAPIAAFPAAGPAFSTEAGSTSSSASSASSWRDLLVGPEGAPVPPERSTCVAEPAGAAPRPASRTPRETPFSWTRWTECKRSLDSGDWPGIARAPSLHTESSCPDLIRASSPLRLISRREANGMDRRVKPGDDELM
jgi:hypothetical protein